MQPKHADALARAFFNAMYWATEPAATHWRIGSINTLSKALQQAFPDDITDIAAIAENDAVIAVNADEQVVSD